MIEQYDIEWKSERKRIDTQMRLCGAVFSLLRYGKTLERSGFQRNQRIEIANSIRAIQKMRYAISDYKPDRSLKQ